MHALWIIIKIELLTITKALAGMKKHYKLLLSGLTSTFMFLSILTVDAISQTGTVTDSEGNQYGTVQIDDLVWMSENLRVKQYNDGTEIPNVQDNGEWGETTSGAWSHFQNDSANEDLFGVLYNFYAATDSRGICPDGWRVPSQQDFESLELAAGMPADSLDRVGDFGGQLANVGGKLKAVSDLWRADNDGAEDAFGFAALPGGARFAGGAFSDPPSIDAFGGYWSTLENADNTEQAFRRLMRFDNTGILRNAVPKSVGQYIRCVADASDVSAEGGYDIPREIDLQQNYPNPFNPTTVIGFTVPDQSHVQLAVYDLLGRQVAMLVDEVRSQGQYQVNFDASDLSSGVYLYRLNVDGTSVTKRMTLIK